MPMFIDYVTLMLVNMVASLAILAYFVYEDFGGHNLQRYVPGFAMVGLIALLTGLHMSVTWPLPHGHNIAFGEMSVLLGVLFLGAAILLSAALIWAYNDYKGNLGHLRYSHGWTPVVSQKY
jgi:putative membrane protein